MGRIVEEADRLSTAANLSGGVTRHVPTARVRPLHARLVAGLRYLIDYQQLTLNRPASAGWLIGKELGLVVKAALDALRAHLLEEGQRAVSLQTTGGSWTSCRAALCLPRTATGQCGQLGSPWATGNGT
ncbi:MAG: TraI domain-containing protein [Gammaproteobacteria bacterium]